MDGEYPRALGFFRFTMRPTENVLLSEEQAHNLHVIRSFLSETHTPDEAVDQLCQEFARRQDSLRVSLSGRIERVDRGDDE